MPWSTLQNWSGRRRATTPPAGLGLGRLLHSVCPREAAPNSPLHLAKDFEGTASSVTGVNYSEPVMSSEDVGAERFMTIRTCP